VGAIEARAREGGGIKRGPPGGFYLTTTSKQEPHEAMENALMCLSAYYTGLRWIDSGHREPAWCTKMESLTEVPHFDQIRNEKRFTKREVDRSFEIQMVAPDLPPQAWVRLVLSELQERQFSLSRMTHIWPKRNLPNQELGPAEIVVVLQSDGAQDAALIFHMHERFIRYSWRRQGLRCQEPRPERTKYSTKHGKLADWNIEDAWDRLGDEEIDRRERLKRHNGLRTGQPWGRLTNIPPETYLYRLGEF